MNLTLTSHFLWQAVRHTREREKVRTLNHFAALFPNPGLICVQLEAVKSQLGKSQLVFPHLVGTGTDRLLKSVIFTECLCSSVQNVLLSPEKKKKKKSTQC